MDEKNTEVKERKKERKKEKVEYAKKRKMSNNQDEMEAPMTYKESSLKMNIA